MPDSFTYHAATFALLGREPRALDAGQAALKEAEARLGLVLPTSVREWYQTSDSIRILAEHSNDDPPVLVQDFTVIHWRALRLLPIRYENQGVCTWALELDGSEDPPVRVDVDSGGTVWQPVVDRFSSYVYSCVWDTRRVFQQPALVQAQNRELSRAALDHLRAAFRAEIRTTGWPGEIQFRFEGDRQAILIWSSAGQADWFVAAEDARALVSAMETVRELDNLGASLYGSSAAGTAVLDEMNKE